MAERKACVLSSHIAFSRIHSHVFRRHAVRCGFESRRRRCAGPLMPPVAAFSFHGLGTMEVFFSHDVQRSGIHKRNDEWRNR